MWLLQRLGHHRHIFHVVVLTFVREMLLRPGEREEVQCLFIARTALRQRDAGWGEEPGVTASQPTFQAAMGEQVSLRNGTCEDQGIMQRECVAQRTEAQPLRVLGRHEHGEWVSRNPKLREKVMLNHGVRIKPHLIGVDHLAHDLLRQVVVGLLRRALCFRVDAKTHRKPLFESGF